MAKEICQDCGKLFEAGRYAMFCPNCRSRRQSEAARKSAVARNLGKIGREARQKAIRERKGEQYG